MSFPKYEEYKDSGVAWLGEVPNHWELAPLISIAIECNASNKGMVENNLLSLSYGRIVRKDINTNDGLLPESFETYQIIEVGDIVLRLTDLQNDQRSLRSGLVEERGIITSAYTAIRPLHANSVFIAYLLRAYDTQKIFYSMGGGLRQSMKFSELRRLPMLLPPLPEQTAIATFLDRETAKIDELVAEQEKLIELLKEKRQAVISHAVTKGLNPDTPMKDSGIEWLGEVPEHWEVKRLKFAAHVQSGVAKGRDLGQAEIIEVPYLRVANVQDGYLDLEDIATIQIAKHELTRYTLHVGDVLMNEGGDFDKLGRGHIWNGELDTCIHQNHVFAVRPISIEPEWINLLTSAAYGRFYFMSRSKQSTNLASISSTNIHEFPLTCPPPNERTAIANHVRIEVERIDELSNEAQRAIDLLKERRSALISAAVTGKIDVRHLANTKEAA
ncbi:MAG: restriction endonuclease subunit S [Halodesulfovibrio sp.]